MGDDHLHFIGEELKQQFGNMPRSHSEQQNRETEPRWLVPESVLLTTTV